MAARPGQATRAVPGRFLRMRPGPETVPERERCEHMSITAAVLITLFVVAAIPLVPTEPVLTATGVLAATQHTSPLGVIVVAALGCSLSDHFLYGFGRVAGVGVLDRMRRKPSVNTAIIWLSRHATRWGVLVLVAGRWLPAGGTVGSVMAGTLRWPLTRFTPSSLVGSVLWSSYAALIGYLGGALAGQPLIGLGFSLGVASLVGVAASVFLQRGPRNLGSIESNEELLTSDMTAV